MEQNVDEDARRSDLKTFLDQCQAEFAYLMMAPANPMPPRESPPLPMLEDLREGEAFGLPTGQHSLEQAYPQALRQQNHHIRDLNSRPAPSPNHAPPMQPPPPCVQLRR